MSLDQINHLMQEWLDRYPPGTETSDPKILVEQWNRFIEPGTRIDDPEVLICTGSVAFLEDDVPSVWIEWHSDDLVTHPLRQIEPISGLEIMAWLCPDCGETLTARLVNGDGTQLLKTHAFEGTICPGSMKRGYFSGELVDLRVKGKIDDRSNSGE